MESSITVGSFDPLGPDSSVDGLDDDRLRVSDVGKLVRRTKRRIVGAARADDRVTFHKLLLEHLGAGPESLDVVRESWPAYDHVNVQAGLDAWLEGADRAHQLVGMVNHRHRDFGLSS